MIVMKFGGAVLRKPNGFRSMVQILRQNQNQSPAIVVVSAFASATRDLEFSARLAQKGLLTESLENLRQIVEDHQLLVRSLLPAPSIRVGMEDLLTDSERELADLYMGVSVTRQLTPRTLDKILAYGEFMALNIAQHVLLDAGIDAVSIDAQQVVVTTGDHGSARPLTEKTRVRIEQELRPAALKHAVVLIQGFVGCSEDGATTTMGKESSNLTAALLGALLGADEVVIWTDVEGIRSADPHFCESTAPRPHLNYSDARTAANHGLKLIYPSMIDFVETGQIMLRFSSAFNPEGNSTVVSASQANNEPIVIVRAVEDRMAVTTVCIPIHRWLDAISDVVAESNLLDNFDIETNSLDKLATIYVNAVAGNNVACALHKSLQLESRSES